MPPRHAAAALAREPEGEAPKRKREHDVDQLLKEFDQLVSSRHNWDSHWTEVAKPAANADSA